MDYKDFLGVSAALLNFVAYAGYFRGMFRGTVKPHVFSWFVWGVLTAIGYAAQVADGGGAGTWVTGISAVACFIIAGFALRHGEKAITRSDWITFIGAMAAIPLWIATDSPLYSVLLITLIDAIAFWPTFRKAWSKPQEESVFTFAVSALKFGLGVIALGNISMITAFYPLSLVVMNTVFVVVTVLRRRALA